VTEQLAQDNSIIEVKNLLNFAAAQLLRNAIPQEKDEIDVQPLQENRRTCFRAPSKAVKPINDIAWKLE
jgi:hypothetical protein